MTRKTTIYRVTATGGMMRFYHFSTMKAARAFVREEMSDENRDPEWGEPEIDKLQVTLNAAGVAQALDDFVSMTCTNEG